MVCAWAPPPRRIPSGLRAHQGVYVRIKGLTHIFSGLRATNTPRQTPNPPKRRPIQQKQAIFSDCHPIALHFGGHIPSSRGLAPSIGGIALHGGPTRRRHAARRLRVVQNPPPTPMWGCRGTAKYGGGAARRWRGRGSVGPGSSPVEWCNRFVSFGVGYALSWSVGSSCWVGWGVSRDLVRMSRLR